MQGATSKESNETDKRNNIFLFIFQSPQKKIWQKLVNYFLKMHNNKSLSAVTIFFSGILKLFLQHKLFPTVSIGFQIPPPLFQLLWPSLFLLKLFYLLFLLYFLLPCEKVREYWSQAILSQTQRYWRNCWNYCQWRCRCCFFTYGNKIKVQSVSV